MTKQKWSSRTPATMTTPALSYEEQPLLREFFELLQDDHTKLTIFCGAGVSVDSGLPIWRELIRRLSDRIENREIRDVVQADQASLTRKVDLILQIIRHAQSEESVIADALYGSSDTNSLPSGQLASAIARLAAALTHKRVRIVTTNYDDRLEGALAELQIAARPLGLEKAKQWFKESFSDQSPSVLHLHGYLSSDGDLQIPPIVLSESRYLREGSRVQKQVKKMLNTSAVLFVGVSMTDPSIIGPLSELQEEEVDFKAFAILVPDSGNLPHEDPPGRRAHAYTVMQGDYIDRELNTRPIILKSYAQVAQCISEAAVAASKPSEYNSNDPTTSVRYGFRFQRVLRRVHDALSITEGLYAPSGEPAQALSDELHRFLTADDGPKAVVDSFISRTTVEEYGRHGIDAHHLKDEQFALFLWLRSMRAKHDRSPCPYTVLLAGTSAYAHRIGKTVTKYSYVAADAVFVAPRSVYFGRNRIERLDLDREGDPRGVTWRSFLGTPLTCTEKELDIGERSDYKLTIGATVLHSNRRVIDRRVLQHAFDEQRQKIDIERTYYPSAISLMGPRDQERLLDEIARAGQKTILAMKTNCAETNA